MTRILLGVCVTAWSVVGAALPPALAQQGEPTRSVGITVSPWLKFDDDGSSCCSGIGGWLQIGRFQIDHAIGIRTWISGRHPDVPEAPTRRLSGHATAVLFDAMTWTRRRYVARFRIGGAYRAPLDPFPSLRVRETELRGSGIYLPYLIPLRTFHVGLTFDFGVGKRGIARSGLLFTGISLEPRLGAGWKF